MADNIEHNKNNEPQPQPQGPGPDYTSPSGPDQPVQPVQPHRGTAVLVLGILGLVLCFILGIVAWVMGNTDLAEMDAGRMDPSGRSITQAGKICGMISVFLQIAVLVIWLLAALGAGLTAIQQG